VRAATRCITWRWQAMRLPCAFGLRLMPMSMQRYGTQRTRWLTMNVSAAPKHLRVMLFCHGLTLAGACRDGSTALMAAVCNDHASVVRLLLRHNARVNEQNTCASLISCSCCVHQTHTHDSDCSAGVIFSAVTAAPRSTPQLVGAT
jgi:hypothetical protein